MMTAVPVAVKAAEAPKVMKTRILKNDHIQKAAEIKFSAVLRIEKLYFSKFNLPKFGYARPGFKDL